MLFSAGDGRHNSASEIDSLQAVAHLALLVPAMIGVVQAKLAGIVFPEARYVPVDKEHAPADNNDTTQARKECWSFQLDVAREEYARARER